MNQLAKAPAWLFYMAFFLFTAQLCKMKLWKCSDDFPQKVVNISKNGLWSYCYPCTSGISNQCFADFCFFISNKDLYYSRLAQLKYTKLFFIYFCTASGSLLTSQWAECMPNWPYVHLPLNKNNWERRRERGSERKSEKWSSVMWLSVRRRREILIMKEQTF